MRIKSVKIVVELVTENMIVQSKRIGPQESFVELVEEQDIWLGSLCFLSCPSDCIDFFSFSRDCTQKPGRPGFPQQQQQQQHQGGFGQPGAPIDQGRAQQFDSEYASLMAELGETSSTAPLADGQAPPTGGHVAPWNGGGPTAQLDENGEKIPPWRIPSNWLVLLFSSRIRI